MERSYRFMVKYGQLWKVIFGGDNFLVKDNSDLNLVTDKLRLVLIDEVDEFSSGTVAEGDDTFAQSDEELQNSLTDFYVRCRVVEVARHLFDRMTERDSMLTGGYGKNGSTDLAGKNGSTDLASDDPSNTEMSVGLTSPSLLRERPKLGSSTFVIFDQANALLTATLELSHNADVVEENMRAATFGWITSLLSVSNFLGHLLPCVFPKDCILQVPLLLLAFCPVYMKLFLAETINPAPRQEQHSPCLVTFDIVFKKGYNSLKDCLTMGVTMKH